MHIVTLIVLWLSGLQLVGFGVAFLIDPLKTLGATGIHVEGALAATELRAFYGGLEVAVGLLLIAWTLTPARRTEALWLNLAIFGGIGVTRVVSMWLSGADTTFLRFAATVELVTAFATAWCLWARLRAKA